MKKLYYVLMVAGLLAGLLLPALAGTRNRQRVGFRGSVPKAMSGRQTATNKVPYFADGVMVGSFPSTTTPWDELSGMCRCARTDNADYAWFISDQVGSPFVFRAYKLSDASDGGIWTLTGATGVDVEAVGSATVGGQPYVYVADIGDNGHAHGTETIYRIKEPKITGSNGSLSAGTDYETIVVQYPASPVGEAGTTPRDAEAFFVDPDTGDMYILTKRTTQVQVFKLAHASSYSGTQTLVYQGDMFQLANTENPNSNSNGGRSTDANISPDGTEIIVRNYAQMYLFQRNKNTQTIYQALTNASPIQMKGLVSGVYPSCSVNGEPQGEGCMFGPNGRDIYTCSEFSQNYSTGRGFNSFSTSYPLFKYSRLTKAYTEVSFQDGVSPTAGYAGTLDNYLNDLAGSDNTTNGAAVTFIVDYDITPANRVGLLKFNLSTIPSNATIVGCDLTLYINTEGAIFRVHKMLEAWDESTTKVSLGHIPAFNDVQASSVAECTIGDYTLLVTGAGSPTVQSIVLKMPVATVQAWVSGTLTNNGWLFYNPSTADEHGVTGNGFQFRSREATTPADRPKLTVRYTQ